MNKSLYLENQASEISGVISVDSIIRRIAEEVEQPYRGSTFYSTLWEHVSAVAEHSLDLAKKTGADQFVAEAGGLLHDLGGAMYGREEHHITGIREAAPVLVEVGCPLESIGPILHTIFCHRGSQGIVPETLEAMCVAAADAWDHFRALEELCRVQVTHLGIPPIQVFSMVSAKLEADWEKIAQQLRSFIADDYQSARQKLVELTSGGNGRFEKRRKSCTGK